MGRQHSGEFQLAVTPGDQSTFNVKFVSDVWRGAQSNCPLVAGRWAFLVGVRRADALEIWVDGSLRQRSGIPEEDVIHFSGFAPSAIGAWPPGNVAQAFFRGDVDELRLFRTALTADQIARLYLDEKPQ